MNTQQRIQHQKTWRARRKQAGLTLQGFADKYRFDIAQLSRWENRKGVPSFSTVERVEAALKHENV